MGGKIGPPPPPLLSSYWRQSVLGAWAEGRDGWGVGATEWEVIGGALHWLTKRQCTKIKTCGQGNGTVFFIHLLPLPKGLRKQQQQQKNDICFISGTDLLHFVMFFSRSRSLTHPSFLLRFHSLIRTFSHFLSTSPVSYLLLSPYLVRIWAHILRCIKKVSRWYKITTCIFANVLLMMWFFLYIIKNYLCVITRTHLITHKHWGANKFNRFTCVFMLLELYRYTVSISLLFICFLSLLIWFADFITALLPATKNKKKVIKLSLCATLETLCYWAALSYKPWWLHSMWENFLVNSPNCCSNAPKSLVALDYCVVLTDTYLYDGWMSFIKMMCCWFFH